MEPLVTALKRNSVGNQQMEQRGKNYFLPAFVAGENRLDLESKMPLSFSFHLFRPLVSTQSSIRRGLVVTMPGSKLHEFACLNLLAPCEWIGLVAL